MPTRTRKARALAQAKASANDDALLAASGVALVASVAGNVALYVQNKDLHTNAVDLQRNIAALMNVIEDWQSCYRSLDAQLALALAQVQELRQQLERSQARRYAAEQRALAAELERAKLEAELRRARGPQKASA